MRLFFDMDGVLAVYEASAYRSVTGEVPAFEDAQRHYFRSCLPDERMVEVARALRDVMPTAYLTKIHSDIAIASAQFADKVEWLRAQGLGDDPVNVPHALLDRACVPAVIACLCTDDCPTKAEWLANVLGDRPHAGDILIDDRNEELQSWTRMGGVAIKCCNGYSNSVASWNGLSILPSHTASDIVTILRDCVHGGFAETSLMDSTQPC